MKKPSFLAFVLSLVAFAMALSSYAGAYESTETPEQIEAAQRCADVSSEALEEEQAAIFEKPEFDETTVVALAQTVWGEADGCSKTEKAAVVWSILNRADNWDSTPYAEATAEGQYHGYNSRWPVTDENRAIVEDVLYRHHLESLGLDDVGRVLPLEYMWFYGDGVDNHFRDDWQGSYNTWDWSLASPYE